MITFEKIRWKNFLSTGKEFTEFNFKENKSTLFVGLNGAGKSTMLDALSYALYSKPYRDLTLPKLINSINKKDCLVELEFNVNNVPYMVRRGMKPKVFELYRHNTLVDQQDIRDYQAFMEDEVLKINHKSFSQIVVLGSANYVPFMKLKTPERRKVIEDILDLNIFSTMNELLKEKIKTNKENILQNENDINVVKSKIEINKKYLDSVKETNEELIQEKRKSLDELQKKDEALKAEIKAEEALVIKHQEEVSSLQDAIHRINKIESMISLSNSKINNIKSEINFYENTNVCPTCSQSISDEYKSQVLNKKQGSLAKVNEAIHLCQEEIRPYISAKEEILNCQNALNTARTKVTNLVFSRREIANYYNKLIEDINLINTKSKSLDISDESGVLADDLNLLLKIKEELIDDKEVLSVAVQLLKDGGIKSIMIKQYIPEINKIVNKYLESLDFFVNFELDENFNETIKSRYRDDFSYENFSEGEKSRIDLALMFTWRQIARLRNSISTNLLIMDEVFDGSMDAIGSAELIKILDMLTVDSNIVVISHKESVMDHFDNIVRFKKVKNFSIMEK